MNKVSVTYTSRQNALTKPRSAEPQWEPGLIPDEFSYNDVWRIVRKHKLVIFLSAALAGGLALALCLLITPKFRSTALIEINRENTDALGLDTYDRNSAADPPDGLETTMVTQTEANILRGSALAQQVTQQLGLENRKEFSLGPGYFDRLVFALGFKRLALSSWLSWLSNQSEVDAEKSVPIANSPRRQDLIRKGFEKNLKVDSIPGTRLIQVQFLSPDPYVAANVVNTLINDFIDQHIRSRYSATAQASDWLSRQLQDLKSQAESSQAKVNNLQDQVGILAADETKNVTITRLDELNKQLVAAETNRILKEAAYRLTISANPELISAAGSNLDSATGANENANRMALIQNLRAQEATLKSQYAQAQVKFGPSYPTVLQMQSQLGDLENSIQTEIQKLGDRTKNDYTAAANSERDIRTAFEQQKQIATEMNDKAGEYAILKRQAESDSKLYSDMLTRLKEGGVLAALRSTKITIVNPAQATSKVAWPNTPLFTAAAAAFGLMTGLLLAFLREAMDKTIRTPAQIEASLGLPCVGSLPQFANRKAITLPRHRRRGLLKLGDIGKLDVFSLPVREAYQALHTWILSYSTGKVPKVILVTSALPEEGKTTTSVNIAAVLAADGKNVLLVEADLRRPRINKLFHLQQTSGLADALAEKNHSGFVQCWLDCNMYPDIARVNVLPAGSETVMPSQLLGSKRMDDLLRKWRGEFDFIVIDTPPVLVFTDAAILSRHADAVLFVVRSGKTTAQAALRSRELLERVNVRIDGVLINGANLDSPDFQDYFGYSSSKYESYYHAARGRSA